MKERKRRRIETNGLQLYLQNKATDALSEPSRRKIPNQSNSLQESLYALQYQQILCDVEMICEQKSIKAHKIILATFSKYWNALFSNRHFTENKGTVYVYNNYYYLLYRLKMFHLKFSKKSSTLYIQMIYQLMKRIYVQ